MRIVFHLDPVYAKARTQPFCFCSTGNAGSNGTCTPFRRYLDAYTRRAFTGVYPPFWPPESLILASLKSTALFRSPVGERRLPSQRECTFAYKTVSSVPSFFVLGPNVCPNSTATESIIGHSPRVTTAPKWVHFR